MTSLCDDFENIVISTANGISDDDRELFELVKKNSLTSLSVRKDSISNYVRPIEDNYITFDYAEVDDIDVIKNLVMMIIRRLLIVLIFLIIVFFIGRRNSCLLLE